MADDDAAQEVREVRKVLERENEEIKKGFQQHDASGEIDAARKVSQAIRLMNRYLEQDLLEKVRSNNSDLSNAIRNFENQVEEEYDMLGQEEQDVASRWTNVKKQLSHFSENQDLEPVRLLNGDGPALPEGFENPYGLRGMSADLAEIIKSDLNPLIDTVPSENESYEALQVLRSTIHESVRDHRLLNEYKSILEIALQDEELLRRFAENDNVPELRSEYQNINEMIIEVEQRIEELEDLERDTLEKIEEANNVLERKLEIDEEIVSNMDELIGSESGRLSSASGMIGVVEEIEDSYSSGLIRGRNREEPEDLLEACETVRKELAKLRELASQISNEVQFEEREDYGLKEDVKEYVEDHRELLERESEMGEEIDEEAESISQDQFESGFGDADHDPIRDNMPAGAFEYERKVVNLLEAEDPKEILKEFQTVKKVYKRVHRFDEEEYEDVAEFDGRVEDIDQELRVIHSIAEGLAGSGESDGPASSSISRTHISDLFEGKGKFRKSEGLKDLFKDIQKLKSDVMRLHKVEEGGVKSFRELENDLKRVEQDAEEYIGFFDEVEDQWRRYRNEGNYRKVHRAVAYNLYEDDPQVNSIKEAEERLTQELKEKGKLRNNINEEMEDAAELLSTEVKLEEGAGGEEGEVQRIRAAVNDLRSTIQDFKSTVISEEIGTYLPERLNNQIKQRLNDLMEIEEEMERLENIKEREADELEHLFEEYSEDSAEMESEGSGNVDDEFTSG